MGQNRITPQSAEVLGESLEIEEQPTMTYKMNTEDKSVRDYTNGLEAVRQAVYKILMTERFEYIMYSENYGIETVDLYGQELSYVCPELERRVSEALLQDDRINSVDDFSFETEKNGIVKVTFAVHTVFGDIMAEREVNI